MPRLHEIQGDLQRKHGEVVRDQVSCYEGLVKAMKCARKIRTNLRPSLHYLSGVLRSYEIKVAGNFIVNVQSESCTTTPVFKVILECYVRSPCFVSRHLQELELCWSEGHSLKPKSMPEHQRWLTQRALALSTYAGMKMNVAEMFEASHIKRAMYLILLLAFPSHSRC